MVQFVHLHPQCKQYTVIYMLSIFVHLCTSQLVPLIELDWSQDPSNQTVYPVGPDYRVHSDVRFVDGDQKKWFEQNFIDEHELEKTADRGEPEFGLWYPTRYRRQLPATTGGVSLGPQLMAMFKPVYVIRLAVFYDRKMSQMHNDKRELNSFIRGILQQVQLIYRYRSMQTRFRIQVLSIEQVSGSPLPDSAGGEVDRYLESFCAWQRIQHSRTASAQQWDHAILLTGERLYRLLDDGSKNYKVLGMAWVNGMCNINLSCTLQEAESFEASFTIAHEMGHSLGILHDGPSNTCDHTKYLMSNTTGTGKVHWSPCSNIYVRRFLQSRYGNCLNTNITGPNFGASDTKLPGEDNTPNAQCLMARGSNAQAYLSRQAPFDNVCRMLWCRVGSFAFATHPALEGSKCSADGQCYQGECVSKRSPKYVAFRNEALIAIRDLMQLTESNRLANSSSPSATTASATRKSNARLDQPRRTNVSKAKAASLARNANIKKNQQQQKKRLKSSDIASTSVLLQRKQSNVSTGSPSPTAVLQEVTTALSIQDIAIRGSELSRTQSSNTNVTSNPSTNKKQPKIMSELKSFFRGLTSHSQGLFAMFKTRFG